jgi:hypothetical protein
MYIGIVQEFVITKISPVDNVQRKTIRHLKILLMYM